MASYSDRYNPKENPIDSFLYGRKAGFATRLMRRLGNFGMEIKSLIDNSVAIGANEIIPGTGMGDGQMSGVMDDMEQRTISAMQYMLNEKSIPYYDYTYPEKRGIIQEYANKTEIKDYVMRVCEDAIIYDEKNYFCRASDIELDSNNRIKDSIHNTFTNIYRKIGFDRGKRALLQFRDFIVNGYTAYEIVYDEQFREIIGYKVLDPVTLVLSFDPETLNMIWIQNPQGTLDRRILLDNQIVFLSYSNANTINELSYVESLIRPYNIVKIMEDTRIIFNVTNASMYRQFTIPVDGPGLDGEMYVQKLINRYQDDVYFDSDEGKVYYNGRPDIPLNKEYWLPSRQGEAPTIENITQEGYDLNEDTMLQYFRNNLKRSTRIPFNRFDTETGGGTLFGDTSEVTRDEITYSNYIDRVLSDWKEIITKPLWIQMCLDYPELKDDELFKGQIGIRFNKDGPFEEWRELRNMEKRATIATTLLGVQIEPGGLFAKEWILKEVMQFSDKDIEENRKDKIKEKAAAELEGGAEGEEGAEGGGAEGGGLF